MPFAFEKLAVYQKAISFADSICTLTRDFPRGYYFLVDQLNRAALSIAANIAEGNGRFTKADSRKFSASHAAAYKNAFRSSNWPHGRVCCKANNMRDSRPTWKKLPACNRV